MEAKRILQKAKNAVVKASIQNTRKQLNHLSRCVLQVHLKFGAILGTDQFQIIDFLTSELAGIQADTI